MSVVRSGTQDKFLAASYMACPDGCVVLGVVTDY